MSLISATLGLDKSSSQKAAAKGQAAVAKTATSLYNGDADLYKKAQTIYGDVLTNVGGDLTGLHDTTTEAGRAGMATSFGAAQRAAATAQAAGAQAAFPNSPDLAHGFALDAVNGANERTAQYAADLNSPQSRMQAFLAYLQAAQAAHPDASGMSANAGIVMGNPQAVQQPNGILGALGTIAGQWAGSGFK